MSTFPTEPNDLHLLAEVRSSFVQSIDFGAVQAGTKRVSFNLRTSISRTWPQNAGVFELFVDFLLTNAAVVLSYCLYHELRIGKSVSYDISVVEAAASVIGLLYVMMLKANGAYTRATSLLRVKETERVIAASTQLFLFTFAVGFWVEMPVSRLVVLFASFSIPSVVLLGRYLLDLLYRSLVAGEQVGRRTIIYGAGLSGMRVFSLLARSPKLGLDPVAVVDDDVNAIGKTVQESGYSALRQTEVLPGPISAAMLRELSADVVIICSPYITPEAFRQIGMECAKAGATLSFVPHDTVTSRRSLSYWDADGVIFASVDEQRAGNVYRFVKRAFDFAMALFLLLLFSPLLLAVAAAVRLTSEGPALFVQERVGKNGRLFKMYKFRTMYLSAPKNAYSPISKRDRRITGVGALLRRTSIDELPQLLNVLKGEMSLVGPRPEMPFIVEQYNDLHRQRLQVLPGITGLWQISAGRAQLIHENIQYDLYYIRNQSFFMDLAIILHTAVFAMHGV